MEYLFFLKLYIICRFNNKVNVLVFFKQHVVMAAQTSNQLRKCRVCFNSNVHQRGDVHFNFLLSYAVIKKKYVIVF